MLNDAHCHFFSAQFFSTLGGQRGRGDTVEALCREMGWDAPGEPETLADRWVRELDAYGVARAALIASVPSDETSVAAAVAKHPAASSASSCSIRRRRRSRGPRRAALGELGLRGICLFPAMHHVPLHDHRARRRCRRRGASGAGGVRALRRAVGRRSAEAGAAQPLRSPAWRSAGRDAGWRWPFPQVPFIIPHFGAGLFREALMAADTCANIYLDTSSSNGWIRYSPG